MESNERRLEARVHGRVQGVSFRYHTREKARALGLTGWVMNREDGTVQVVAEGTEKPLHELEQWLYHGSPDAQVEEVYVSYDAPSGDFTHFMIAFNQG